MSFIWLELKRKFVSKCTGLENTTMSEEMHTQKKKR